MTIEALIEDVSNFPLFDKEGNALELHIIYGYFRKRANELGLDEDSFTKVILVPARNKYDKRIKANTELLLPPDIVALSDNPHISSETPLSIISTAVPSSETTSLGETISPTVPDAPPLDEVPFPGETTYSTVPGTAPSDEPGVADSAVLPDGEIDPLNVSDAVLSIEALFTIEIVPVATAIDPADETATLNVPVATPSSDPSAAGSVEEVALSGNKTDESTDTTTIPLTPNDSNKAYIYLRIRNLFSKDILLGCEIADLLEEGEKCYVNKMWLCKTMREEIKNQGFSLFVQDGSRCLSEIDKRQLIDELRPNEKKQDVLMDDLIPVSTAYATNTSEDINRYVWIKDDLCKKYIEDKFKNKIRSSCKKKCKFLEKINLHLLMGIALLALAIMAISILCSCTKGVSAPSRGHLYHKDSCKIYLPTEPDRPDLISFITKVGAGNVKEKKEDHGHKKIMKLDNYYVILLVLLILLCLNPHHFKRIKKPPSYMWVLFFLLSTSILFMSIIFSFQTNKLNEYDSSLHNDSTYWLRPSNILSFPLRQIVLNKDKSNDLVVQNFPYDSMIRDSDTVLNVIIVDQTGSSSEQKSNYVEKNMAYADTIKQYLKEKFISLNRPINILDSNNIELRDHITAAICFGTADATNIIPHTTQNAIFIYDGINAGVQSVENSIITAINNTQDAAEYTLKYYKKVGSIKRRNDSLSKARNIIARTNIKEMIDSSFSKLRVVLSRRGGSLSNIHLNLFIVSDFMHDVATPEERSHNKYDTSIVRTVELIEIREAIKKIKNPAQTFTKDSGWRSEQVILYQIPVLLKYGTEATTININVKGQDVASFIADLDSSFNSWNTSNNDLTPLKTKVQNNYKRHNTKYKTETKLIVLRDINEEEKRHKSINEVIGYFEQVFDRHSYVNRVDVLATIFKRQKLTSLDNFTKFHESNNCKMHSLRFYYTEQAKNINAEANIRFLPPGNIGKDTCKSDTIIFCLNQNDLIDEGGNFYYEYKFWEGKDSVLQGGIAQIAERVVLNRVDSCTKLQIKFNRKHIGHVTTPMYFDIYSVKQKIKCRVYIEFCHTLPDGTSQMLIFLWCVFSVSLSLMVLLPIHFIFFKLFTDTLVERITIGFQLFSIFAPLLLAFLLIVPIYIVYEYMSNFQLAKWFNCSNMICISLILIISIKKYRYYLSKYLYFKNNNMFNLLLTGWWWHRLLIYKNRITPKQQVAYLNRIGQKLFPYK